MSTTTITLPADHDYLASLPDGTRDELVLRSDGVAVLTERVGKVVFDGTESQWMVSTISPNANAFFGDMFGDNAIYIPTLSSILSDMFYFAGRNSGNWQDCNVGEMASNSDSISSWVLFMVDKSMASTVATWKAWLAANPVTVYYKLKTPATSYSSDNGTTWSTTDPNAGNSAIQLYKGTNNVWCTDPLSPEVSLDYVQDTNKVIIELRAAIVASGATS